MTGPFWNRIGHYRVVLSILLAIILGYNLFCSVLIGERLLEDPRMEAQEWVKENTPNGHSYEFSAYSPTWNRLGGVDLEETKMPVISGRRRLFEDVLKGNPWVMQNVERMEAENEQKLQWYSLEQLLKRSPDFLSIDSLYYSRFIDNRYYPTVGKFFIDLLNEEYPYRIIFDRETKHMPAWIYPKNIDFLENRIIILQKEPVS